MKNTNYPFTRANNDTMKIASNSEKGKKRKTTVKFFKQFKLVTGAAVITFYSKKNHNSTNILEIDRNPRIQSQKQRHLV